MSDQEVDDILASLDKKKKVDGGKKGKRVERNLCKVLNVRFMKILSQHPKWGTFTRSVGSGNRWGQKVALSEAAQETFSGDISVPTGFRFVLESKGGYNDYDLNSAFDGGHAGIDEFLKQVSDDADRCGRKPILLWKKDRKPRLAALKAIDLPLKDFTYMMKYRDWAFVNFEEILSESDEFFFKLEQTALLSVPS